MSKSREPEKTVFSETSSGEEENDDSFESEPEEIEFEPEEIESEPEPIRRSSAPPSAARKPHTPSATQPASPGSESVSDNNIKDSVVSNRRFLQMKARLFSGLGENLPAVEDLKPKEGHEEEAWKKLENEEMDVNVRYFEVMTQQSKLLLKIMKSRDH